MISTDAGRVDQRQVTQRVQYNPTVGPNLGLRATYDLLSITFSKRLWELNQAEVQKYGRSDFEDWRVGYALPYYFSLEGYYQNYKSFYTDLNGKEGLQSSFGSTQGSSSQDPNLPSQIVSRSDISAGNLGLRLKQELPIMWIFRAFANEKDKESMNWDLLFLTKLYYNQMKISGDQALVPNARADSFSPIAGLREMGSSNLGLGFGIGCILPASENVVFKVDATVGRGYQRQNNRFNDREESKNTTSLEMNSNFSMDWKGQNHGAGFALYFDSLSSKVGDFNLDTTSAGANVIYTYSGINL